MIRGKIVARVPASGRNNPSAGEKKSVLLYPLLVHLAIRNGQSRLQRLRPKEARYSITAEDRPDTCLHGWHECRTVPLRVEYTDMHLVDYEIVESGRERRPDRARGRSRGSIMRQLQFVIVLELKFDSSWISLEHPPPRASCPESIFPTVADVGEEAEPKAGVISG